MRYVVFMIHQPEGDAGFWKQFFDIVDEKLKPQAKHVARAAQTVWLVDNQAAPAALAWLLATAENHRIGYSIASFDSAPEWRVAGFDPRTNQA